MDCAYTLESFLCQSYIKQGPFVRDGVCPRGHLSGGGHLSWGLTSGGALVWGRLSYFLSMDIHGKSVDMDVKFHRSFRHIQSARLNSTQLNQFWKCSELRDWQKNWAIFSFFFSWVELSCTKSVQSDRRALNTLTTQLNSTQLPAELSWVGRSELALICTIRAGDSWKSKGEIATPLAKHSDH